MIYALVVTNVIALLALAYSLRLASAERRILFSASLEAGGKTDAARRAAGPTYSEAKAAVDQQLRIRKELEENGGVFTDPARHKPVGI